MRSGNDYLKAIRRDGRQVYIDGACVDDVTTHPAFREATQSIARLFDVAADPANRELLTYPSPKTGEPVNRCYMIPRSREDLTLRRKALWRLSEESFGYMGRTPEHVAGFFAAFAGAPSVWARAEKRYYDNVVRFYERMRDESLYVAYTIVPPQIDRSKPAHKQADPTLYAGVVAENADGITIKGAQMLGTGSAIADFIQLSCIHPLVAGDENYAISVAIPCNAPGVRIYSRRSYAEGATSMFDYPLASRFDETDSLLVYDNVFVPWEHVFVYKDIALTRASFFETAAHLLGNNQAQIRFRRQDEVSRRPRAPRRGDDGCDRIAAGAVCARRHRSDCLRCRRLGARARGALDHGCGRSWNGRVRRSFMPRWRCSRNFTTR